MKSNAIDDILLTLGSWGRYEKLQFWMLMLPLLPTALHIVSVVFIGRSAEHHCAPLSDSQQYQKTNLRGNDSTNLLDINYHIKDNPYVKEDIFRGGNNSSYEYINQTIIKLGKCNVEVWDRNGQFLSSSECPNGHHYKDPEDRTFVSEWNLVCEKETMSDLSQTIMAVGMMVGAFGFTSLSDRYGRKTVYLTADLMLLVVAVATAFAPNFGIFALLRFFTGVAQQGVSLVAFILMLEKLPTAHRPICTQVGMFTWPLSLLSISVIAYVTKDMSWRYTQLAISACSLYALIQYWMIDESVRWLLVNKRTKQAERVLRKAARNSRVNVDKVVGVFKNKTQPTLLAKQSPIESKDQDDFGDDNENGKQGSLGFEPPKESFITALGNRHVFKITTICCYIWLADSATYYGLIMMSGTLVENLYLGYALNILVEFPAGIAFLFLTSRYGRRTCMIVFHLVAGLALLIVVALKTLEAAKQMPGVDTTIVVISLVGKFGSSGGYGVAWMYTPELFPTNIRTTGVGLASLAARVGVMVMPFSRTLERHLPWAPGVIFGVLCLMIPVLTLFLPEMRGKELPQTVADLETLESDKGQWRQNGQSRPL